LVPPLVNAQGLGHNRAGPAKKGTRVKRLGDKTVSDGGGARLGDFSGSDNKQG